MKKMFFVAILCAANTIACAQHAQERWFDNADRGYINYGPPESDALMSLVCKDRKRLVASVPAPAEDHSSAIAVMVEGLGGTDRATGMPDPESDGMMNVAVRPDSILVTSLLTEQPVTIRAGSLVNRVSGTGAGAMFKRLIVSCLGGVQPSSGEQARAQVNLDAVLPPASASRPAGSVGLPGDQKIPRFADYPANCCWSGPHREAILDTRDKYAYRTRLRDAGRGRVNFAGRFSIATWGCGTSCLVGGFVDHATGRAEFLPNSAVGAVPNDQSFEAIIWKSDSRLLILSGMLGEQGPMGMHFFVLQANGFEKIFFIPMEAEMNGWGKIMARVRS